MFKLILVTLLISSLAACMSMPFKAMYKITQLNPVTIEPSELTLALRTDQTIDVATGSVVMEIGYTSPEHNGLPAITRNHKFNVMAQRLNNNERLQNHSKSAITS